MSPSSGGTILNMNAAKHTDSLRTFSRSPLYICVRSGHLAQLVRALPDIVRSLVRVHQAPPHGRGFLYSHVKGFRGQTSNVQRLIEQLTPLKILYQLTVLPVLLPHFCPKDAQVKS